MTTQHAAGPATDAALDPGPSRAPLILTLGLSDPAQALFQGLRNRHFPPERNLVPAHISLFHALPGAARDQIVARLDRLAEEGLAIRTTVRIDAPFPLGRGVGFRLASPGLQALRARLATDWADWLTPQDRQGFRPHVTVQNKVAPETARALLARLQCGFVPFDSEGVALRLWRYLDGPWEALHTLVLKPGPAAGLAPAVCAGVRRPVRRVRPDERPP